MVLSVSSCFFTDVVCSLIASLIFCLFKLNALWIVQLKSYLWMGKLNKAGVYGPLQFMTYLAVSVMAAVICITGLVLYANVYHQGMGGWLWDISGWLTAQMGGLAMVRIWHHYLTWAFVIFVVIHVYMAVWTGIRFKHNSVDSIVSGYDYHPDKH